MNKFFRLVSMFAIAGATFAYTGCTDYSEDIDKANERIDNLETGRLKNVEDQVKGLETTVSGLSDAKVKAEAAITELQTALGKLQEKHAADIAQLEKDYKAADGALKSEIEGKITALTTDFTNKVTTLNSQIGVLQTKVDGIDSTVKSIQETIKGLATKEYVDAAFATKDALAEANKAIAALNTTLETVQSKVATLGEDLAAVKVDIAGINSKLTEAQTAIAKAQEDATKALGEIAEIKEALKTYALKAEVEAKIEELVAADLAATGRLDNIDKKIDSIKTQITDLFAKDVEFADQITQLFNEKFNKADFAEAFKAAYEARFTTDFAAEFAKAWAEYFQPAFNTAFETAWDAKFQGEFDSALENVLGIYAEKDALAKKIEALDGVDEDLQNQIDALDEKLDKAVEDLNGKITKLDEKVEQYNTALNTRIDAVLGIIEGRLTGIVFVPEHYYDGVPAILFETIAYDPLKDADENEVAKDKIDDDQNSVEVNKYAKFSSAVAKAQYRLNPRTVGVDCADFSFVGDKANYVFTRATAPAAPVSIVGAPEYDAATGYVTFSVKKDEKINTDKNVNKNLDIVALKAVLKKGLTEAEAKAEQKPEVYSEYAHVNEIAYCAADLAISDKAELAKYAKDKKAAHEYAKTFKAAAAQDPVYPMPYDKPFDLKKLVATCITTDIETPGLENVQDHANLDLEKYGFTYRFSVAQTPYVVESAETKTDQNTVIECTSAENGTFEVKAAKGVEHNREAIGRTPIVRVDLMHGDNIVTRAFIKLVISVDKTYEISTITDEVLDVTLLCEDDAKAVVSREIPEETLRDAIYRTLNLNHVEFWNMYEFDKAYVDKNAKASDITAPELKDGTASDGKATKKVVWNFTHKEVGTIGAKGSVIEGYLTVKNTLDAFNQYPSKITFKFTVNFKLPELTIVHKEKDIFWKDGVLQANVNRPNDPTDVAENCWFNTPIAEQPWEALSVKGLPCNETPAFRIIEVYKNGVKSNYKGATSEGIYLSTYDGEVSIALDKNNASIKQALNSEKGLQALVEWYAVGKSGDVYSLNTFMVNFIRPVTMFLPEGLSVKDAVDGGDEITFGYDGLLKDWRGEAIIPPTTTEVLEEAYYWNKVCSPADHAVVIPGYTKIVKDAYYEPVYGDAEAEILTGEKYYEATVQLYKNDEVAKWYEGSYGYDIVDTRTDSYGFGYFGANRKWFRFPANSELVKGDVIVATGRSKNEALQYAKALIADVDPNYLIDNTHPFYATYGDLDGKSCELVSVVEKEAKVTIKYRTIVDIKYHPAETEEVEAQIVYSDCNEMPGPGFDDVYTVGQRIGCWEWQKSAWTETKPVAGQYWDFYGEFSDVVLDLANNYKNVKTDLPDGKLPSKATLEQSGYTLRYENVQSPIQHSYHIFIPASIQYGWGVLNGTLTITVNPVSTIK